MRGSRQKALGSILMALVCASAPGARAAGPDDALVQLVTTGGQAALGALVSREGLIWTTRAAIAPCADALAARADVDGAGFVARSFDDELPCPGVEARTGGAGGADARLGDVRLVFAPELSVADFGGPEARVHFPRAGLDVVLLRAWDADRPIRVSRFAPVSARGPVDGDDVIAPGQTPAAQSLVSMERIAAERDALLPFAAARLGALAEALRPLAARNDAQGTAARRELRAVELRLVHSAGRLALLRDPVRVAEAKRKQDEALLALRGPADAGREAREDQASRAALAMDAAWRRAAALGPIADATGTLGPHGALWTLAGAGAAGPDALEAAGRSAPPIHVELEVARLAWGLESLRAAAPPRDALVESTLRGKTARARAEELVRGTALTDPARRQALVDAARTKGAAIDDPLVALRAAWDARARAVADELARDVTAPLLDARARLDTLAGADAGVRVLVGGTARGATVDGRHVHWSVTAGELFSMDRRAQGAPARSLPERWRGALTRVDFSVPLAFQVALASASVREGGPLLGTSDRTADLVVGLLVGTQSAALADDLLAPRGDGRAVAITSNGLLHALDRVYDAKHLVDELLSSAADR